MNAKSKVTVTLAVLALATSAGAITTFALDQDPFDYSPRDLPTLSLSENSRFGGDNRYETAAKISQAVFPKTAPTVLLTSGKTYPDGLSAGSTATRLGAPILLTEREKLPAATITELQRLTPEQVLILGGNGAISSKIESELAKVLPDARLRRVEGQDRYETSAKLVHDFWPESTQSVMLTTGADYPDALVGSAAAAKMEMPLLLTNPLAMGAKTAEALQGISPQNIYLVGSALEGTVRDQLEYAFPEASIVSVGGKNRFETAFGVAKQFWDKDQPGALVASASSFPDAMSGAVLSKASGLPILLSGAECNADAVRASFKDVSPRIFLGGIGAVKDEALSKKCGPAPNEIIPGQNHIVAAKAYAYPAAQVQDWLLHGSASPTYPQHKIVFLTFDDGPSERTVQNLQTMAARGVHATFFVLTNQLGNATNQQILKNQLAGGHATAIHSASHNYDYLYPGRVCSPGNVGADYAQAVNQMHAVLGPQWGTGAFRYPGGQMSWKNMAPCNAVMAGRGMSWIDWNIEAGDALSKPLNAEQMLQRVQAQTARTGNVAVVLMHDSKPKTATVQALPGIIDFFASQGYTFGIIG